MSPSKMLSKRNIALVAAFAASRAAADTIGAAKSAQGVTEIFGNSFGRPGKNATYDYIVSLSKLDSCFDSRTVEDMLELC